MIDQGELKVGSRLFYKDRIIEFELDDFTELDQNNYFIKLLKPIPMSEQWLKDFNLSSREGLTSPTRYWEYSIRNDFEIYCQMDKFGNCLFWIGGEFIVKCDSVHMFQNIYGILNPHDKLTKQ